MAKFWEYHMGRKSKLKKGGGIESNVIEEYIPLALYEDMFTHTRHSRFIDLHSFVKPKKNSNVMCVTRESPISMNYTKYCTHLRV